MNDTHGDPDHDLIEWCKQGDQSAFDGLCIKYERIIYAYFRRLGYSHDTAEDLTQETLIAAWRDIGNFRRDSKFSTWLFSIARNKSLMFIRANLKRSGDQSLDSNRNDEDSKLQVPDDQPGPRETAERKERSVRVRVAIDQLPQNEAAAIKLQHDKGLSLEQIAEELGRTENAVRNSLRRARRALLSLLESTICQE